MVNREELEICKRRGHAAHPTDLWSQCKFCGVWLRAVTTIEEREDEPPEDELDPLDAMEKLNEELGREKGDEEE